jgi:anti-sigma B factor antagonist
MNIETKTIGQVTVVQLDGDVDGNTAPEAQAKIVPLAVPGCKMVLDLSKVAYMSSAGLRLLLVTYRTIKGQGGEVVLVGLSPELSDTMSMTGFLDFFEHHETLDAGLAALA